MKRNKLIIFILALVFTAVFWLLIYMFSNYFRLHPYFVQERSEPKIVIGSVLGLYIVLIAATSYKANNSILVRDTRMAFIIALILSFIGFIIFVLYTLSHLRFGLV